MSLEKPQKQTCSQPELETVQCCFPGVENHVMSLEVCYWVGAHVVSASGPIPVEGRRGLPLTQCDVSCQPAEGLVVFLVLTADRTN